MRRALASYFSPKPTIFVTGSFTNSQYFSGTDWVTNVGSPQACTPCKGWSPNSGTCWYIGNTGVSCNSLCGNHGGFNQAGTTHTGNAIGTHFYPWKTSGGNWQSVECSSTDNNTNRGATGAAADGTFTNVNCHLACQCNQ